MQKSSFGINAPGIMMNAADDPRGRPKDHYKKNSQDIAGFYKNRFFLFKKDEKKIHKSYGNEYDARICDFT